MIKELLVKVSAKQDLTFDEAKQAIEEIMSGEVSEAVISSFAISLSIIFKKPKKRRVNQLPETHFFSFSFSNFSCRISIVFF